MNEHQRKRAEIQQASRQFLSALSAGQAGARDRFNNIIEQGQRLLYKTPFDLIYDVVAVSPVLDPNVPAGMMDVTLSVRFPLRVMANQVNPAAVIVGEKPVEEAKPEPPPVVTDSVPREVEAEAEEAEIWSGAKPLVIP